MIGIIAAVSKNGVIGVDGKIPWNYPEDLKYFKEKTINSTVIMGRKTFESIGKPLPKRRNIVITSTNLSVETRKSVASVNVSLFSSPVWFIGGASIYQEAMNYADEIHLTLIPDVILYPNAIRFPWICPTQFKIKSIVPFEENSSLQHCIYERIY